MELRASNKSYCFPLGLCILMLLISACSMQKSGKVDSSQTNKRGKPPETVATNETSQDKMSIKVDYLTPLSAIRDPDIFVYKEKRRLYIVQSNVLVRDYPIGLGFNPRGDKEKEGDGRTPEGEFKICVKNASSRFVRSLGLNYPDKKHAERAFFAGSLTPVEFRDILLAFEKRATPPWSTSLGGRIFIHAGGAHKDWTDGCIALYNSDMEELFQITSVGTLVSVRP